MDGLKEFVAYRGLEIIQLTPGSLQAEFLSIQVGDIHFIYVQTNQGTQAFGEDLKEYRSFSIAWFENEREFSSYHHPIDPRRTLFGFNGMGADLVVSQGAAMIDIYIPLQNFSYLCRATTTLRSRR